MVDSIPRTTCDCRIIALVDTYIAETRVSLHLRAVHETTTSVIVLDRDSAYDILLYPAVFLRQIDQAVCFRSALPPHLHGGRVSIVSPPPLDTMFL